MERKAGKGHPINPQNTLDNISEKTNSTLILTFKTLTYGKRIFSTDR
jgi:hypothetical protein